MVKWPVVKDWSEAPRCSTDWHRRAPDNILLFDTSQQFEHDFDFGLRYWNSAIFLSLPLHVTFIFAGYWGLQLNAMKNQLENICVLPAFCYNSLFSMDSMNVVTE